MIRLPFWKVQSIGNDFPLFNIEDVGRAFEHVRRELEDPLAVSASAPPQATDGCSVDLIDRPAVSGSIDTDAALSRLAIDSCDRHFGIGGDGLLLVGMEDGDVRLRMFNPDGTEDFCGNGIRCAALYAHEAGWVGERFRVRHLDAGIPAAILGEGKVRTTIGIADYTPARVPLASDAPIFDAAVWEGIVDGRPKRYQGSSLSTGSTHTVIWNADPTEAEFLEASRLIENDRLFPNRTSVLWAREIEPNRIEIRIWERGVGETFGCGTGSSAAAADYLRRKGGGGEVQVLNRGGALTVSMDRWDGPITIEGVAQVLYRGEYVFRPAGV